jgi:hypothetical protein
VLPGAVALTPFPKNQKFLNEKPAGADWLFVSPVSYSLFFFKSLIAIMALEISSGAQL